MLDTTYPEIDHDNFNKHKWDGFYGEVKEAILTDMPETRGKSVDLNIHVNIDHTRDKWTRWSRTELLIFMNKFLIHWMSKKKPTIKTSFFGAYFVAMTHGIEKTLWDLIQVEDDEDSYRRTLMHL